MKTAAQLSMAELRKLEREFEKPTSIAASLVLAGVQAEIERRECLSLEEVIDDLETDLKMQERECDNLREINSELRAEIVEAHKVMAEVQSGRTSETILSLDQRITEALGRLSFLAVSGPSTSTIP